MDPVTHALSGFVLGKTITKNKKILVIILISTLLPDIDILLRLHSRELFLMYHRGITHGVGALFIFPILTALLFHKKLGFFKTYFASFLAYALHILLDFTNQYGVKILSPLDWNYYSLSLAFVVDPYVLFPLLFALLLSFKLKNQAKVLYIVSMIFIVIYMGTKAYLKAEARDLLKQKIEAHQYRVYPLVNDFLRWWFVAKHSDEYITGFVDLFTKKVYFDERYKIKNEPAILKSKESKSVKVFLSFAKHPVAETKHEGDVTVVLWRELSYGFLPNDRFTVKVWLKDSPQGYKILNSNLRI